MCLSECTLSVKAHLQHAVKTLEPTSDTARLDAELLLASCLNKNRTWLMTWPDYLLSIPQQDSFAILLKRRQQGEPIAYILGYRDFWNLRLMVNPSVLIPRPETELLVETALEKLPKNKVLTILDLGTGSGAIALAIANERPLAQIIALDNSDAALQTAQQNATLHHIESVQFLQSHWFSALPTALKSHVDLIVSNPPYIAENNHHLKQGDLRFEPEPALISKDNGLQAIQHIIQQAGQWLKQDGNLLLEHGYDQQAAILSLLKQADFSDCFASQDLAQIDRVSGGTFNTSKCPAHLPNDQQPPL